MGFSLQTPVIGEDFSSAAPKVDANFGTLASWGNGNVADADLVSPNNGVRKLQMQASTIMIGAFTAGTYFMSGGSSAPAPNGANSTVPVVLWIPDSGISSQPTDFQVANKSPFCRMRSSICANGTSPGVTFTIGLYQLVSVGGSSGVIAYTFGSVIAGTTVALAPTGSQELSGETGQFAMPVAAGNPYGIGVAVSGTMAAASVVSIVTHLYGYNA